MIEMPPLNTKLQPNSWLDCVWNLVADDCSHQLNRPYVGRFAPSPSGSLHQGSLITALASYLHAHWHGGVWLLRMEDVDSTRCTRACGLEQIQTLSNLGFRFAEPIWQSDRDDIYQNQFNRLQAQGLVYPCTCTRRDIGDGIYRGTCRQGHALNRPIRSWRYRVGNDVIRWVGEYGDSHDERLSEAVGDFVLKRSLDGERHEWTYQFAVVVDDALQGVTHVVRGEDLLGSTARQVALQQALGYATPTYNHVPLLLNELGMKLSKSGQAPALDVLKGLEALQHAWVFLGGERLSVCDIDGFWSAVLRFRKSF